MRYFCMYNQFQSSVHEEKDFDEMLGHYISAAEYFGGSEASVGWRWFDTREEAEALNSELKL